MFSDAFSSAVDSFLNPGVFVVIAKLWYAEIRLRPFSEPPNSAIYGAGLWKEPRSYLWSKSSVPSISKDIFDSGTDISRTSTAEAMEAEDSATVSLIGMIIKKGNIKIGKNY